MIKFANNLTDTKLEKKMGTTKEALKKYKMFLKGETHETKEMILTFKDLLHKQLGGKKNPTDEEIQEAVEQLKELGKLTALVPLVALPGSIITIPLLVRIGKRYNINILPDMNKHLRD